MNEASISQVRSFNRLVAERVGAVGADFLGRKRTLGDQPVEAAYLRDAGLAHSLI